MFGLANYNFILVSALKFILLGRMLIQILRFSHQICSNVEIRSKNLDRANTWSTEVSTRLSTKVWSKNPIHPFLLDQNFKLGRKSIYLISRGLIESQSLQNISIVSQ